MEINIPSTQNIPVFTGVSFIIKCKYDVSLGNFRIYSKYRLTNPQHILVFYIDID